MNGPSASNFLTNVDLRTRLRQGGPPAFIVALANNFPVIRKRFQVEPWNAMSLRQQALGTSHGEKCAVQFVLRVWNASTDWDDRVLVAEWLQESGSSAASLGYDPFAAKLGKFDVFDALGVWDDESRAAFLEWAKDPIWP
jgi:hypothetical protein